MRWETTRQRRDKGDVDQTPTKKNRLTELTRRRRRRRKREEEGTGSCDASEEEVGAFDNDSTGEHFEVGLGGCKCLSWGLSSSFCTLDHASTVLALLTSPSEEPQPSPKDMQHWRKRLTNRRRKNLMQHQRKNLMQHLMQHQRKNLMQHQRKSLMQCRRTKLLQHRR
ncbi:hypothetical protein LWI28_005655 [Acer negundo]|uniref:Uncharacterized protein n=1 Tax=Acer negundo TaxID=4023 RepID=A0AAD5ICB0_ACENE|nr:hypothetical protein LWI28_005655 [Acer negundo]